MTFVGLNSPTGAQVKSRAFFSRRTLVGAVLSANSALMGGLAVLLVAAGWQLSASYELVDPMFLPPPAAVLGALKDVVTSNTFLRDLRVSGYEFGLGLGLSILIGGLIGVLSGWYRPIEGFFKPIVIGLNSIPHLTLIPLLILLFGIGTLPKVILVLLSCVVVMIMNTASGVQNVDVQLMRMARSFGASDRQIIRTVVVPAMIPYFMTGVRICVGKAVVNVAVAEIFGSTAGLGNILIKAQSAFNMPVMFASVIILTIIGITLTQAAAMLEKRIQHWQN